MVTKLKRRGLLVGDRRRRHCKTAAVMEESSTSASSSSSPDASKRPLTISQLEQLATEARIFSIMRSLGDASPETQQIMLELWRENHVEFLNRGLRHLGPSFRSLDANRPWLCYWILHSLALLGEPVDTEIEDHVVEFLSRCQDNEGGYGGGPGQLPHLAVTYASVNALITLGTEKALSSINREKLLSFFLRMKDISGGFRMHKEGEIDVRACYVVISVASCLNILSEELVKDVGNYIQSCQTYEGGIAGEPGSEAHGGYTFCGLATMVLIAEDHKLDLPALIDWAVFRQGVEGGFQGRTNKLVDGCYSFWQGGVLAIAQQLSSLSDNDDEHDDDDGGGDDNDNDVDDVDDDDDDEHVYGDEHVCDDDGHDGKHMKDMPAKDIGLHFVEKESGWGSLFHSIALQQYVLLCCQVLEGGLRDKPGKQRDHYHTCYCLSGLSLCQYSWSKNLNGPALPKSVLGPFANLLEPVHPLHNLVLDKYYRAHEFFHNSL